MTRPGNAIGVPTTLQVDETKGTGR